MNPRFLILALACATGGCGRHQPTTWVVECRMGESVTFIAETLGYPSFAAGQLDYTNTEGRYVAYFLASGEACIYAPKGQK